MVDTKSSKETTKRATARCPICGKPADAVLRPFCSKRCADEDLRRWLTGGYRIPTKEGPGGEGDESE